VNLNSAVVLIVGSAGFVVMVVVGAVVSAGGSTVHVQLAGVVSRFPSASVARTSKLC
jgi:hypothetical protein